MRFVLQKKLFGDRFEYFFSSCGQIIYLSGATLPLSGNHNC